jgi:outer membrane immunogenic protein
LPNIPNNLIAACKSALSPIAAALTFSAIAASASAETISSHSAAWDGFYGGVHFGMATADFDSVFDSSEIPQDQPDDAVFGRFFDLDGFVSGLHAGFNRTSGNFVYGAEIDWTHLGLSDGLADPNDEGLGTTDNASAKINWVASLRGRAGVISGRSLLYATAGIAWADVSYTARNADNNNFNAGSKDLSGGGYVVGGGIEHALTNRFTVRLEGLYYGFDRRKDTSGLTDDSDPGDYAEIKDIMVARLGVSYALNGAAGAGAHSATHTDLTGFYVGGHAGYGNVDFDGLFDGSEIGSGIDTEDSVLGRFFDLDGALGGLHVGYMQSSGRFVYGVEADWSYLGKSDRVFDPDIESEGTDNATVKLHWLASLRGRLGVTSAQSLFYATAGIAWVDGKYTARNGDENNENEGSTSIDATGIVFGGGIEHALSENVLIRFEALHYNFDKRIDTSGLTTDSDAGDFAKIENITTVRIGASYRFNFPGN